MTNAVIIAALFLWLAPIPFFAFSLGGPWWKYLLWPAEFSLGGLVVVVVDIGAWMQNRKQNRKTNKEEP